MDHFKSLSHDLVLEIMAKLDGCSLAATASTCTHLHDAAQDERLWKKLCHQTWPSTSTTRIPLLPYKNLFADTFPLVTTNRIDKKAHEDALSLDRFSSDRELISFIDIYYKGRCIFSKVVEDTIQSAYRYCGGHSSRFLSYPFKLDLVGTGSTNCEHVTSLPLVLVPPRKSCDERRDTFEKIAEDMRLSWILLNRREGKAVNISSWKPHTICKVKPSDKEHIICFGCIIPREDSAGARAFAEFVITSKCKLNLEEGSIRWKEVSLELKDMGESDLNGENSLRVMERALRCNRTVHHDKVESGYQQFCKKKLQLKLRKEQEEVLANILWAAIAISALLGICYACGTLL